MLRAVFSSTSVVPMLFMALLALYHASNYGVRWEIGLHGLPRTLLAADGVHYLDGAPADRITVQLVRSGWEDELWIVLLSLAAVILLVWWRMVWVLNQSRRKLEYRQAKKRSLGC